MSQTGGSGQLRHHGNQKLAGLSAQFWRLHSELDDCDIVPQSGKSPKKYESTKQIAFAKELASYMDDYLPDSAASFGGSLPLSADGNSGCVAIRSGHIWRDQRYALPKNLQCFRKFCEISANADVTRPRGAPSVSIAHSPENLKR
jgi:hypothetical protein